MMAQLTLGDVQGRVQDARRERRPSVHDPCVSSGAMLLGAKKAIAQQVGLEGLDQFRFYGQDIDPHCVRMATIQMLLTDYRHMRNVMLVSAYEVREDYARGNANGCIP